MYKKKKKKQKKGAGGGDKGADITGSKDMAPE